MSSELSDEYLRTIERLRAEGVEVFGPGPVQKGSTTPTKDDVAESPGMHVQIAQGSRLVEGFGGTAGMGGGARQPQAKGEDTLATVAVSLEDAHKGGSVPLRLPNNKVVNVKLPEGVEDGQQIRLKGQGQVSPWGGEPGDAIVTVKFERHPRFRRDGADLRVEVPITLYEAVLGGKVRVPTLDGEAELTLPANVNTSKALRLKGKGLRGKGDLYATLKVVLPEGGDPDLESLMRFWRDQKPYKVRD